MATISTSGIVAGQIIRAEHLLRVINALNGTTPIDIKVTGSLAVSGSLSVTGSAYVKGLTTTAQTNILTYNPSTGQLYYTASSAIIVSGSQTTPGGSTTQIQFNSGSTFAGINSFTFNFVSQSLQNGFNVTASGQYSHAEGQFTTASANYSHAQGYATKAVGLNSHAEGTTTTASGSYSHAEGSTTQAVGGGSHAEGQSTSAIGNYSHAEGDSAIAQGANSHAEGYLTLASGSYSHAEGNNTTAFKTYAHSEGKTTIASGSYSHAEGESTRTVGDGSHAEGYFTTASGDYSHAEGSSTTTLGNYSHAEGLSTITSGSYQHVQGQYNLSSSAQSAFIIGNGTSNANRSNLVFASGSTFQITGSLRVSGSITGSLFGTASWANNATTASYASNFNYSNIITGSVNYIPYYSSSNSFGNSVISQTLDLIGIHTTSSLVGNVLFTVSRPSQQSQIDFVIGNPGSSDSGIYSNNTLGVATKGNIILYAGTSSVLTNNPEILRITGSTGNIGIRTTTPQYTLDISGSTRINDILILEPRSTTPGTPTNGMTIVSGSGANQHIYCYLNSTWKQLD